MNSGPSKGIANAGAAGDLATSPEIYEQIRAYIYIRKRLVWIYGPLHFSMLPHQRQMSNQQIVNCRI
jgi:hypothetical protein